MSIYIDTMNGEDLKTMFNRVKVRRLIEANNLAEQERWIEYEEMNAIKRIRSDHD